MSGAFPQMAEIVSPSKLGCAEISHYEISTLDAMRDSFHGIYTEPGKVAILRVAGKTVMSDTTHERRSNLEVLCHAKGHVLIAGLGLGMILHPILGDEKVQTVTVIEKQQDVIDLIAPTLPKTHNITIVCADIFNWKPTKGQKWDAIYFDIWADICTDNLKQIAKLHQRFKGYKAPGGWMDSWCSEELRYRKRQGY